MKMAPLVLLSGSFCFASPCFSEQQPSIELLKFLGEWQDDQGESVDPFDYSAELDLQSQTKESVTEKQNEQQQTDDE